VTVCPAWLHPRRSSGAGVNTLLTANRALTCGLALSRRACDAEPSGSRTCGIAWSRHSYELASALLQGRGAGQAMSADQKRYEVFLSSTYGDLREARQRVTMTLLECDAFPTGMEIFPATDDDAWTLICRVIDECDYYLLVIAGKYGSISSKSGLSYTEMEYDYAVSVGKPVMGFLHGDLGELKSDLCEDTEERRTMLKDFREKVQKSKHVKYWRSSEELAGQVALSYNKFVRSFPATGWVRADKAVSNESLKELLDAKSRIEELEAALRKAKTSAPAGSEDLAQGSDKFGAVCQVRGEYRTESLLRFTEFWYSMDAEWDDLFATVAPQLLQEAEESSLRKRIEEYLLDGFLQEIVDEVIARAKADRGVIITIANMGNITMSLVDDTFGTILVQLRALGLIQRSERKRSVNDTGTYWTLTPYGESRTIQLRAIKKEDPDRSAFHALEEFMNRNNS